MQNVVVMGKGDLAIKVADWFLHSEEHELVGIVPVTPEPVWTKSFADWGYTNRVQVIESGHYKDLPEISTVGKGIDLAVSVFYDKIIKAWFIEKCGKIINLHNGPLPKYRGVSPINWALKNEEVEHGITIHEITPGIDDGPIIGQLKYSIYPEFDEVCDVYKRSLEYGWVLFQQTIPLIHKIKPRPQEHEQASYYSKVDNPALGERTNFTRQASLHPSLTFVDSNTDAAIRSGNIIGEKYGRG
jgi:methionyl-tRNA formyltransferase